MSKKLVIVESPTKIKTISKILGKKYKVVSSMGHLIDLPKSTLGVDVDNDFEPKLIVVRAKQKILTSLKKEAKTKDEIYFASDPDREGEAIGWNLVAHIGEGKKIFRVTFQEITKSAVLKAFENPREFNHSLIKAQTARRVLDRIVGYKISPLLWQKVGSRLSAGRVQSVALRLIVEREKAIQAFIPNEYWRLVVDLQKAGADDFLTAGLEQINGEKFESASEKEIQDIGGRLKGKKFSVTNVKDSQRKRNPLPPFITSTLQQDAFNKLGFNADRTMRIAQTLYEGVDVGDGETVGLITYMRTDSVNISVEALGLLRDFIQKEFGAEYLPAVPNQYKSKKSAQQAHEAIRPADVLQRPENLKVCLDNDQYRLYELIWNRFVSSQMQPAIYKNRKVEIMADEFQFGVSGSNILFDGFLKIYRDVDEEESTVDFSKYKEGDMLTLLAVKPSQHFTKPPPRFSDASLVKALEEDGIGRPSTYASIIQTLTYRNYVLRQKGYFQATDLGIKVSDLLVEFFARIMDVGFTADMEEKLDEVEEGKIDYVELLRNFYEPFKKDLEFAGENMVRTQNFVDEKCPECGQQMALKWGRRGKFLSCSDFPKCKFAKPVTTGVRCPNEGCGGELIQRQSKGRHFYGCSKFPNCSFTANSLPKEDETKSGNGEE